MLNKALLKRDLKISYKLWLIITAVLVVLLFCLLYASTSGGWSALLEQYYCLFAAIIPIIYIGRTANKLIASQIDNGSLAYVMSAPLKRQTVSFTQAFFLIMSSIAMYAVFMIVSLICFGIWNLTMDFPVLLLLTLGSLLLNLMICGISYLFSCIFNSSSLSSALGTGIPLFFFLLYIVSSFAGNNEILQYCKYFTINTLYNTTDIINLSSNIIWQFIVMGGSVIILFTSGMIIFQKKDLPL